MALLVSKKALLGSIAATVVLGATSTMVFASSSSSSNATTNSNSNHISHRPWGMMGMALIPDLATDLNLSPSTLVSDFQAGQTVSEIATARGMSTSKLISELETSLQAKTTANIDQQITNFVNGTKPAFSGKNNKAHAPARVRGGEMVSALASALGVSVSTLQSDLKSGETVAQIASAQKVSTSEVINAAEKTTQSQISTNVDHAVAAFVNSTTPPALVQGWKKHTSSTNTGVSSSNTASVNA